MRKLVLSLPIAALLLGASLLLTDAGTAFSGSNPSAVSPMAQATPPTEVTQPGPGWRETAIKTKSGISP